MSIDTVTGTTAYSSRGSAQRPMRAAKVLHLLRRLDHCGEARMAIELAAALNDVGGRAAIAYDTATATHELQRHGIQPIEVKLGGRAPFSGFGAAKRLAKLIADSDVEILHAHGLDLLLVARAAAAEAGVKLVFGFSEDAARVARLTKRQRAALDSADEITVLSELCERALVEAIPGLRGRVAVVPFGVDLSRFDPAQVSAHRVIQQAKLWRVPDDRPVVMLPGRFAKSRGHSVLVEALSLIRDVDLRCIMVGPDEEGPAFRKELGKEVAALGLSDRVLRAEECRDMPAALMLADVVVAPNLEPGAHNRAVIEAMALGRPVVVSDFPVMHDLLAGNGMAWLTPPGDAMALSWAIREALALPREHREELSRRIIDNMRDMRSRDRMCGVALDIYQRMRPGAAAAA
jgi:glycosyltransferase involved in cell wall biosynthesis